MTINVLKLIFFKNGLGDTLISDNATSFTAEKFGDFVRKLSIKHITPPPASPSSNGQAERGVKVMKDLLKKCKHDDPFLTRLSQVLLYYRTVPHSVTQIPPVCPWIIENISHLKIN